MHRIFPALDQRLFRIYFTGQAVSLVGTWVQQAALSWIAYRLTGSTAFLGLFMLAGQLPFLLITPLGGAIADKLSHKRVLYLVQALEMLVATVLAVVAYRHGLTPGVLLGATIVLGLCAAIEAPVRAAFLPELVTNCHRLPSALALYSMTANSARMLGPALAGTLLLTGDPICFAINALSCLIPFYTLSRLPVAERPRHPTTTRFLDGAEFAWRTIVVREALFMIIAVGLATSAFITLLPAYTKEVLHAGSQTYGWLMAASGLGSVCGWAFFASKYGHNTGPGSIGAGLAGQALAGLAFALSGDAVSALLSIFAFSVASALVSSPVMMACQRLAPKALRGRVMAVYVMALMGAWPVASVVWGYTAEHFGMSASFYTASLLEFAAAGYFMLRTRHRLAAAIAPHLAAHRA